MAIRFLTACTAAVAFTVTGCWLVASFDGLRGDASTDAATDGDAATSYYDEVLTDFPAIYLRLGEKSGPSAFDSTNDGHNGIYPDAGVVYGVAGAIAGDPDTAVSFDGAHSIAMTPGGPPGFDFPGTAPFSIELWAMQTQYESLGFCVDHEHWGGGRRGWDITLADPALPGEWVSIERWTTVDGGSESTQGSNAHTDASLPLDAKFHHVVATYDGSTLCIYVDGGAQMHCTMLTVAPMAKTGIAWSIGAKNICVSSPCSDGLIGALDEFALYDHALTPARVLRHYQAGIGQ